ncbi:hypothetical protein CA262_15610 [Sphingobium sp. GW456-12-10-14-TSB1]|uniref:transcriptional regulator domain-containing protein n=1 Tax=Sphingobium sp. GW456-12-10-14-TSB1 TaxID=1987165 RepID=UPI000A3C1AD3|nr:DUF6499 domain-containing protein [Sphingobium sp. GW456-12-10-14-TSB1]OUC56125.1 hypothetical protein CA262_15610 [Sphingobium sp. GW456-12-10-14-TSB1]
MSGQTPSDGDRRLLDKPGFAQEFLRRNPRYRSDYQKVMRTRRSSTEEQEVMARRWGLAFPLRAWLVRG